MKRTLLASVLFLFAGYSNAVEVTADGYGTNYDIALSQAKRNALEKVASTFITSQRTLKDGTVEERVIEYNGGIIESYEIVREERNGIDHRITIVANVEPKHDNRVLPKQDSTIQWNEKDFDDRQEVVRALDDISKAVHATVVASRVSANTWESEIAVNVTLKWQPKWISDLKAFSSVINEEGVTSTNTRNQIVGNITASLLSKSPFAGVLFHGALHKKEEPKNSISQMVCFDADCRNVGNDFYYFPTAPRMYVMGTTKTGKTIRLDSRYIDPELYELYSAGSTRSHPNFPQIKTKYHQPALVIYENVEQKFDFNIRVPTQTLRELKNIEIYLK